MTEEEEDTFTFGLDKPKWEPTIGGRCRAKWEGGRKWYLATIESKNTDGTYHVKYDDGDADEAIDLSLMSEIPREQDPNRPKHKLIIREQFNDKGMFRSIASPPYRVKRYYEVDSRLVLLLVEQQHPLGVGKNQSWEAYRLFNDIWWRLQFPNYGKNSMEACIIQARKKYNHFAPSEFDWKNPIIQYDDVDTAKGVKKQKELVDWKTAAVKVEDWTREWTPIQDGDTWMWQHIRCGGVYVNPGKHKKCSSGKKVGRFPPAIESLGLDDLKKKGDEEVAALKEKLKETQKGE
jgi:hypothetical protein